MTTVAGEKHIADWEQILLAIPQREDLRSFLAALTEHAHLAGTSGDYHTAHYVLDKFRTFGMEVEIEKIPTMLSFPQQQAELFTPTFTAKLSEDIVRQDTTSDTYWRNHTFLAYSPPGSVTAKLVYANYGTPRDFSRLEEIGVDVRGKIVLMRYGECFRGLKIMNAEARGAVGSLIYSDPQEDGFSRGQTYPKGPWRPSSSVQRGSSQFNSLCAGDPWRLYLNGSVLETCGYETSGLIPSHPALPLSYEDALPLLESLGGSKAPKEFRGGLNITYTVGPSDYDLTLNTYNQNIPKEIPNVYAKIPGSDPEAGSILLGNHRDAWVFGAADPNSGTAALLEVARAFSKLLQLGWKPRRTIYLMSWSGEEFGLLGSTAFTELHPEIMDTAIAYLNVDIAVRGNVSLSVKATHSLTDLIIDATRMIVAPDSPGEKLFDKWNKTIETLGSGSDYTAFLDRFGVASMDMTYDGNYGVYHSIYDSFSWMSTQGDPSFAYHQAMTRLWSLMAFRLASYETLPFKMMKQASWMINEVGKLATQASAAGVDLTSLVAAIGQYKDAAEKADSECPELLLRRGRRRRRLQSSTQKGTCNVTGLNNRLAYTERKFVGPGLPNRPWFRHVLQAPGLYLGYGSKAFPGISQALEDGDMEVAQSETLAAAAAVNDAARFLSGKGSSQLNTKPKTDGYASLFLDANFFKHGVDIIQNLALQVEVSFARFP